ncbi:MAG: DMT family transporter [bacterium]|nr:DMT family transporter [bacterium]
MSWLTAVIESILSYFFLSLGFVLQKKHIHWFGAAVRSSREYKTHKLLWLSGLVLVNLSPLLNFPALQVLSPSLVAAVSGLNIIFTLFLSRALLKSALYTSDYFLSGLIAVSIAGIGAFSLPGTGQPGAFSPWFFQGLPLLFFGVSCLMRPFLKNEKTIVLYTLLLSLVSGTMAGYMLILMKLLQVEKGTRFFSYLLSPYLYFYLICGLLSFVAINMAYRKGSIVLISPVQYSSMVFYPALASYIIFGNRVRFLPFLFFCIIIFSVLVLVKKHGHEAETPHDKINLLDQERSHDPRSSGYERT